MLRGESLDFLGIVDTASDLATATVPTGGANRYLTSARASLELEVELCPRI